MVPLPAPEGPSMVMTGTLLMQAIRSCRQFAHVEAHRARQLDEAREGGGDIGHVPDRDLTLRPGTRYCKGHGDSVVPTAVDLARPERDALAASAYAHPVGEDLVLHIESLEPGAHCGNAIAFLHAQLLGP